MTNDHHNHGALQKAGASPQPTPLNAIGQLVQRLAECTPQQWCLIGPDGRCWIGPDPLELGVQATLKTEESSDG